jgi:hypothetical protein
VTSYTVAYDRVASEWIVENRVIGDLIGGVKVLKRGTYAECFQHYKDLVKSQERADAD